MRSPSSTTATAAPATRSPIGSSAIAPPPRTWRRRRSWRSSARYDPARGSVRSWTLGIVRNRGIDALRRASGPTPKLDLDDEILLEGRAAAELTDSEVIRRDVAERVRGALGQLPQEQSQ